MNKMLNKIICIATAGLASSLLLISCDTSLPDIENDGRGIIIQLKVPRALEVTTKGGTLDKIPISNVWVLQYGKENSSLLRARKYLDSAMSTTPKNGTLEVKTDGFSDVDSRFYVIANTVDGFLTKEDTTITGSAIKETELKKKTFTWTGTNGPSFVTAGPIALTTDSIKKYGGKAVIVAPLERAFARITLIWTKPDNSNITITKVDLCNKPKAMAAYARGGGSLSDKYPIWNTPEDKKTVMEDIVTIVNGEFGANGSPLEFYMPENLRGMGTGRTLAEKNMPEKGPGGSLDGCTFILMSGEYKYPLAGGGYSSPIKVQYKIYLGGNLTNDYNIQRGYSYDLKVNISGANSADVRVTITDGRVVVFDDVVVMDTVNVVF